MTAPNRSSRATRASFWDLAVVCLMSLCMSAFAGPWVDSYWPLHDGYTWRYVWDAGKATEGWVTICVSDDPFMRPDGYWITATTVTQGETDTATEVHWKDGDTVKFTGNGGNGGWIKIDIDPPVLLFDEDLLRNGGTRTTKTTVTQNGLDYAATYTVTVKKVKGAVTVPAGTFRDCRSVTVKEVAKIPGQGTMSATVMTAVLAPGVGMIRKLAVLQPAKWAELVSTSFPLPATANNLLPTWAYGDFSGWFVGVTDSGPISMAVTAQGKITGKFTVAGTAYTFAAGAYARQDVDGTYWVSCQAKAGKAVMPLTLAVRNPAGVVPARLAVVDVWFASTAAGAPAATLYRDIWRDTDMPTLAADYAGYYTATLPGGAEYGSGYLTFTVAMGGGIKTAGKLADGTAVSLSGTLIRDQAGRVFAVLYTAPKGYNGGAFFGLAEFVKPDDGMPVFLRLLDDDVPLVWENRNPQATGAYGDGFARDLRLVGGWYDTVDNLYYHYWNWPLLAGTDAGAAAPELVVGANRYASVWWRPDGIALTAVLDRDGEMTGLAAPKPGVPVDPDKDGVWDYSAENTVGLKISLTRATGVFKGSCKAWFDYPTKKHTSKDLAIEGVLIPGREDPTEGVEGRGFFLWADKATYLNPRGKTVSYPFNESYDFLLLATP